VTITEYEFFFRDRGRNVSETFPVSYPVVAEISFFVDKAAGA
jgi:hypothetical protein